MNLAGFVNYADSTIARYHFYIARFLRAAVDKPVVVREELKIRSGKNILGMQDIITNIEYISHHAREMSNRLKDVAFPLQKDLKYVLVKGMETASILFSKIIDAFPLLGEANFDLANTAVLEARRQRMKILAITEHHREARNIADLEAIFESASRICEHTSNVGEMVLNLTIEDLLTKQESHSGKNKENRERRQQKRL